MHKVKAVVALSQDAPVTVTTINVPDPGKGEALVKVLTCGVCQTDHHYVTGGVGQDFPYLLGHESAGIVEAVGDDVTDIAPGDLVILNWRAVCGECRACRKGQPQYCFATHNATQKMTLEDGTELTPALVSVPSLRRPSSQPVSAPRSPLTSAPNSTQQSACSAAVSPQVWALC